MRINSGGSQDINQLQTDSVTFRNKDKAVDDGIAFFGGIGAGFASGQYTQAQFYNPAGSGVTVLIDRILVAALIDVLLQIRLYDTALANDNGSWYNNNRSASDGNLEFRWRSDAGGALGTFAGYIPCIANQGVEVPLNYPIELQEGDGWCLYCPTVNQPIYGTIFGREV